MPLYYSASRFVREIVLEQTTTYKQNREPLGIKENKEMRQYLAWRVCIKFVIERDLKEQSA